MHRRRLIWQLFSSYLVIILISLLFITWYATDSFKRFYQEQTIRNLKTRAYLVKNQVLPYFSPGLTGKIDAICKKNTGNILTRITVILPSGVVIGDSGEDIALMNNHSDRPEVIRALQGSVGSSNRFSNTLREEMVYVAVPVVIDGKIAGVIRTAMSLVLLENSLRDVYLKIILAGLFIASIAALMSYKVSRGISSPLEQLENNAKRFAEGDFKVRLPAFRTKEIENLAGTMNIMANQLDERIKEITRQNKEHKVVLSSMKEGIIAVDNDARVIKLNKSAAEMFNIRRREFYGREIKELVQNPDFHHFIEEALINNKTLEDTIVLQNNREQFIQIYSTPIYTEENDRIGTLIVLNDMTRIKKLENIRRDFVANVSHELRTPITSIKGFVETLLDGGMDDTKEIKSFLKIIKKHANRLNAIIEDLLSISRLEQGSDRTSIILERTLLKNILKSAVQASEIKARAKNIAINITCPDDTEIRASSSLMEQAIINLIDNAINYSDEGSAVDVEGEGGPDEIVIKVRDRGCGIFPEHLSRIFERFYRVDKARSRKLGGTGLGLAIVKHIAQTHGGQVSVESNPGEGSCFIIRLPK